MNKITVKLFDDSGDSEDVEFPTKKIVCPACDGNGSYLNPSIGEHAYTHEEFCESFDDEGQAEYFKIGGIYDVKCYTCKGANVIDVIDEAACVCSLELSHDYTRLLNQREKERLSRLEDEYERRWGC